MDLDHIPVIEETMSASPWKVSSYTGTPKTMDNPSQVYWRESSQAEWIIPCHHCTTDGKPTANVPSLDYHLVDMIGPPRDDINEERPGTICWKCRQPIRPRLGRWHHRYKDRRWDLAGYHIPQIIMPMHYASPDAWSILVDKMNAMPAPTFFNEVCGESYDDGAKLVTETELIAAATLPIDNGLPKLDLLNVDPEALRRAAGYRMLVLGVDWGGGRRVAGKLETSFTKLALVGLAADGALEMIWGAQLYTPHDHLREATQIRDVIRKFRPHLMAHDFTGAGIFRETFLYQAGLPMNRIMPMELGRLGGKAPVRFIGPDQAVARPYWQIDKARTMLYVLGCIKQRKLVTFRYDYKHKDQPGLLNDFLALVDEHSNPSSSGEIYMIRRQQGSSDDFAWATCFACTAIWHATNSWPNFVDTAAAMLTSDQLAAAIGPDDPEDREDYFRVP
jgi:hypothetical protein